VRPVRGGTRVGPQFAPPLTPPVLTHLQTEDSHLRKNATFQSLLGDAGALSPLLFISLMGSVAPTFCGLPAVAAVHTAVGRTGQLRCKN
jgi:hypothetical protein